MISTPFSDSPATEFGANTTSVTVRLTMGFPAPVRLTPSASCWLDAIRALAALTVMLGHARGLFLVDYGHLAAEIGTFPIRVIYGLTGFGHQAVMVFFALSGFFISSSVFRSLSLQKWSWRNYAIDRGVRLYVVLLPGLMLGGLWDLIGSRFFDGNGIYSTPLAPFSNLAVVESLTLSTFTGNALFLQTRYVAVFGSNGPLWSLFNELWYYVLFPVTLAAVLSALSKAFFRTVGYVLLAGMTVWILGSQMAGFAVWMAGSGVALTSNYWGFGVSRRRQAAVYSLFAGALFCACLFGARTGGRWLGSDFAVGFSFALFMHGIVQIRMPLGQSGLSVVRTFAGFSYSLYILHFPLLLLFRAWLLPTDRWQPDFVHLLYALCLSAFIVLYAFGIARFTERNTALIRTWVRKTS